MANIKQQAKRMRTDNKKRAQNASFKSAIRTAVKNVEAAVKTNDLVAAQESFKIASKKLDKSITKGIYHKNYVARQKSYLSKLINTIAA